LCSRLFLAFVDYTSFDSNGENASVRVRPQFEVASVKASACDGRASVGVTPGRIVISNAPLRPLIAFAWKFRESLVAGGPAGLDSAPFDIEGKVDSPAGTDPMFLMLQSLFEDRFQLKLHREMREGPVYELTIAKGGPRLKASNCVKSESEQPAASCCAGRDVGSPLRRGAGGRWTGRESG
jgi:uncharacterized protein (TIGR03435 family)